MMDTWDGPAYTSQRRVQAIVLLGVTVVVVAAVVGASPPLAEPAVRCAVRIFLWLSVASIALLWSALAVVHSSSRARAWISRWLHASTSLPAFFYAVAAALALAIGSYGLTAVASLSSSNGGDAKAREETRAWPVILATVIAVAWTVTAVALVAVALMTAIRRIQPGHETPPAIMLLRCSCCSVAVKRAVLLLPFAMLTTVSFVLWRQALAHTSGCGPAKQLAQLLLGAGVVFGLMLTCLAAVSGYQWCTRRTPRTHKHTQRLHVLTLVLLVAFGAAAFALAVHSCVELRTRHSLVVAAASPGGSCRHLEQTRRSVRVLTGALFIVGALLVSATCCCRLERHLLSDTTSSPSVDLAMLSPHAIRPPTRTKTPSHEAV